MLGPVTAIINSFIKPTITTSANKVWQRRSEFLGVRDSRATVSQTDQAIE
jgi:hypothetical protein